MSQLKKNIRLVDEIFQSTLLILQSEKVSRIEIIQPLRNALYGDILTHSPMTTERNGNSLPPPSVT